MPLFASDTPAGDRRMPFGHSKGVRLRNLDTKELRSVRRWCAEKDDESGENKWEDLIKAIDEVLEERAADQFGLEL